MTIHRCLLPGLITCLFLLLSSLTAQAQGQSRQPLKVFVLVGQSNMQGHAHVRTLEHVRVDKECQHISELLLDKLGQPVVSDKVWISYLSSQGVKSGKLTAGFGATPEKIGPELMFGFRIQQELKEPVLIIKTAWGGKSLNTDFRSPSAGPYKFSKSQLEQFEKQKKDVAKIRSDKLKATGHYYRETIKYVKNVLNDLESVCPEYNPQQGYELAGFVWFQGWNDMVDRGFYPQRDQPGGYDRYSELMAHFIRDVRHDLGVPKLPFVIGVLGVGGPVAKYDESQRRYRKIHQNFRDAMAAPATLPEFKGNVTAVLTENCWDPGLARLRKLQGDVNQRLKKMKESKNMSRDEERQARELLNKELFAANEQATLEIAVSNAEYHYLGSAKILCQIGDAFAEAVLNLRTENR